MTTSIEGHYSNVASGRVQIRAVQVHSLLTSKNVHVLEEETKPYAWL